MERLRCQKRQVAFSSRIVSEDGDAPAVAAYMASRLSPSIQHLTQPDIGFRKNRALNRAILAAHSDHLIFIDGDCVPHPAFIESHLKVVKPGVTATGRRVELRPDFSSRLRKHQLELPEIVRPMSYLRSIPALKRDGTKNYEYGLHYPLLQWLSENRTIRLVGCNLSIHRDDLLKINGFNEDYESPGIGEDSDIDWRLQMAGVTIRNVKFSAVQYHGGPCTSSVTNSSYTQGFLEYVLDHDVPLDFFSWHRYAASPYEMYNACRYIRQLLDAYGYFDAENINTEWNLDILTPQRDKDNARNAAFTA